MSITSLKESALAYADRHSVDGAPFETPIAELHISRHLDVSVPFPVLYRPLFCLVLQGSKQAWLNETTVTFAAGHSVVVGMDLPTFAQVNEASEEEPYVALALKLDVALFKELAGEMKAVTAQEGAIPAIASGEAGEALIEFFREFGIALHPDPRVVDQHVEAPELATDALEHGAHGPRIGNIRRQGAAAHFLRHRFGGFQVQIVDQHLGPLLVETPGHLGAQPRTATGNQCALSRQSRLHRHGLLLFGFQPRARVAVAAPASR